MLYLVGESANDSPLLNCERNCNKDEAVFCPCTLALVDTKAELELSQKNRTKVLSVKRTAINALQPVSIVDVFVIPLTVVETN